MSTTGIPSPARVLPPISIGTRRIIAGAILLLAALGLGLLIRLRPIAEIDLRVLGWFVAHRTPAATAAMEAATMLFSPSIAVFEAIVIGLLVGLGTRSARLGTLIPVAMAAASGTTSLMKEAIERVRPALPDRIVVELSHSYPSGHTTAAAALAVSGAVLALAHLGWSRTVAAEDAEAELRWRRPVRTALVWAVAALLVVLIALTRVYLGAHWLSDVLGGAMVGSGVALLVIGAFFEGIEDARPVRPGPAADAS